MFINQQKRKSSIRSPKPLVKKMCSMNIAVESEYQLKLPKNSQKKETRKQLLIVGLNESHRSHTQSTSKRKLSFRKEAVELKVSVKQQKYSKQQIQELGRQELAMAIEYCKPNNLKQNRNSKLELQSKIPLFESMIRRVRRIRSNDSLLINRKSDQSNQQILQTLSKVKKQNKQLKTLHFKSLKDLKELEHEYAEQKTTFEKEEQYYLNKIQALRRKVQNNKTDIGHLFSYKNFDSAKLIIKPIVEVEGESSSMRSFINSSDFKQLNTFSCFIPLSTAKEKEQMTEATSPTSRESCRDLESL